MQLTACGLQEVYLCPSSNLQSITGQWEELTLQLWLLPGAELRTELGHVLTEHGRILKNPSNFLLCVATTAAVAEAPSTSHRVLRLQSQLNAAFFNHTVAQQHPPVQHLHTHKQTLARERRKLREPQTLGFSDLS